MRGVLHFVDEHLEQIASRRHAHDLVTIDDRQTADAVVQEASRHVRDGARRVRERRGRPR